MLCRDAKRKREYHYTMTLEGGVLDWGDGVGCLTSFQLPSVPHVMIFSKDHQSQDIECSIMNTIPIHIKEIPGV